MTGGDADSDPTNELQSLSIDGTDLSISDGNTVVLPGSGSVANSLQDGDGDTKVQVEEIPGENKIRMDVAGVQAMIIDNIGNIGVGLENPTSKMSVGGIIESTSGGVKFPDGTVQTTAYTGGASVGCVNKVVRGTITFTSDGSHTVSFSPAIDPAKSVTMISPQAVMSSTSGQFADVNVTVTNLTATSITIEAWQSSGTHIVGFQIIEYQ